MANNGSEIKGSDDLGSEKIEGMADTFAKVSDSVFDCTFGTKTWREDASLVVGDGKELFVSSTVLSLVSPVLCRMFEEKLTTGCPLKFELRNKTYREMVEFLQCIYPNILKKVALDNVFVVLPMAVEFEVKELTDRCEKVLLQNTGPSTKIAVIYTYLCKAHTFHLKELREKCINEASKKSYQVLQDAEKAVPLPVEVKVDIQNFMIDSMEKLMNGLKVQNLAYSRHDSVMQSTKLGRHLDWYIGKFDIVNMKNPRIGYIENKFTLKDRYARLYTYDQPKNTINETVIHGLSWFLSVDVVDEIISLYLHAKPLETRCPHNWKCTAYATLVLRNINDKDSIIQRLNHVYNADHTAYGAVSIAQVNKVSYKGYGFVNHEDKVNVEAYILAEEPIFS